jgi:hypothetical protein
VDPHPRHEDELREEQREPPATVLTQTLADTAPESWGGQTVTPR